MTARLVRDLDEHEYHAARDSLSVSGAKVLLKSPAKYRWQQDHPIHRDVFDFGTAAHKLVLGVGAPLEVIDADSWRTKAAQEARTAAREAGTVPLLKADHERVMAMADALSTNTTATALLSEGEAEVSAYRTDAQTGATLRGRFDWLADGWIADYKTTVDADPQAFATAAARFDYAMQAAWYLDLAHANGLDVEAFIFIAQAKEAPYEVSVCQLDWASEEVGRVRNRRAIDTYAACVEAGKWPSYGDQLHTITLPKWALNAEDFAS